MSSESIPRRRLGKTDLDVSVLGFGAAPVSFLKTDAARAADVLNTLLDRGVNLVDTATSYRGSHAFLGEHFTPHRRDDFVLVDKVGTPGGKADKWTPEVLKAQVDDSLREMRVDHVDVMLLHSCSLDILEADEALGALVDCREAGKVRFVGYSGDNEAAAFACRLPDIAVLECSVNVADQANADDALVRAGQHDVGVIAKRPLANAAWKDLQRQPGFYKTYAKTYTARLEQMNVTASDLGENPTATALAFTLAQPAVTAAIVGTTDPAHAAANLRAAADLPDVESARYRAAFASARAAHPDADWSAQT